MKQPKNIVEKILRLFPLMFIVSILPLLVSFYPHMNNLTQYPWFGTQDLSIDYFLHCKSVALNAMGVYMLIMLMAYAFMGKLEKRAPWILIPVLVYALFAFASSAISPYASFSFSGISEGFESIWTVLTYCLIVVYSLYMIRSAQEIKAIVYSFAFGICILTIIGFMQAFGHNPLSIPWITTLTIPKEYREIMGDTVKYNAGNYLTLYNINYVGVYMTMTIPVMLFMLFDFNKEKSLSSVKSTALAILNKFIFLVLLIGAFFCLYKSESEAGILALCAAMVCIPFILYRRFIRHKLLAVAGAVVVVGAIAVLSPFIMPAINRLGTQFSNTAETTYDLSDVHTEEDGVYFTYKGNTIRFAMEEDKEMEMWDFCAYDANGEKLPLNDSWIFSFDEPYSDFAVTYCPVDKRLAMVISVDGVDWTFSGYKTPGSYQLFNNYNKWTEMPAVARFTALDGKESLFSGRGYIWSRTLPLLKQSAVLGIGSDCFMFAFPQLDYLGRMYAGYDPNDLFTKPHSLYLQMAVQHGVIALLAFLTFFGMYFFQSIKLYATKKLNSFEGKMGLGILIAMIAYMITGLTNDSMVVVSPLFWTLMGLGIVANHLMLDKPTYETKVIPSEDTTVVEDAVETVETAVEAEDTTEAEN